MRRLLTALIFAGACAASVTFPISDHGYTLSLAAPDLIRVDTPMSDPLVYKAIEDVSFFETIIIGANHSAAVLGKRASMAGGSSSSRPCCRRNPFLARW